ncbi:MAG: hypothetical protein ACYS9Y_03100 [Planctomycetota bacterium]
MEIDSSLPPVTFVIEPPAPTEETPPEPPVSEPLSVEEPPIEQEEEELPGVIQNLLEGHYTGVADVRLRINFADVLAAIEQEQIQAAAAEQIDVMLGTFGTTIAGLLGNTEGAKAGEGLEGSIDTPSEEPSDGPTEEQLAAIGEYEGAFVQELNESKEVFITSETPSQEDLVAGLNGAFDSFITSLISIFEPPPAPEEDPVPPPVMTTSEGTEGESEPDELVIEEGGTEGTGEINGEGAEPEIPAESGFDYQGFIESLTTSFTFALDGLINALNEVHALPELSEPNGNGVSFDKFLAIYNELQNPETGDDGTAGEEPLETVL